jgi:hypothetical protein
MDCLKDNKFQQKDRVFEDARNLSESIGHGEVVHITGRIFKINFFTSVITTDQILNIKKSGVKIKSITYFPKTKISIWVTYGDL